MQLEAAKRISQAEAISTARPNAKPCKAHITGCRACDKDEIAPWKSKICCLSLKACLAGSKPELDKLSVAFTIHQLDAREWTRTYSLDRL